MSDSILTASIVGLDAYPVRVEADITSGLSAFIVVGLPDAAVQEARERVRSALKQSEVLFPRTRVAVNLAPADVKKSGTPFDVAMALAIMVAQGDLPARLPNVMVVGELGLDGSVRPIHGVLAVAALAKREGIEELIVPAENAAEAALIGEPVKVRRAATLRQIMEHLLGREPLPEEPWQAPCLDRHTTYAYDFAAIRGQAQARRALEIAAAGAHNLVMQGPPGSGKTLLARSFPSILPNMTLEEALDVTRIHSIAGILPKRGLMIERPFRAPHHSASMVSLIGGGAMPRPGEISLAHRGVLFLDEMLEFPRTVLESLRQPLEDGTVTVSRAQGSLHFPARMMFVGALNPCPCGFMTDTDRRCECTPIQINKYRKRLSGPLLDRIDLFLEVPKVKTQELSDVELAESSSMIRTRVEAARQRQLERYRTVGLTANSELGSHQVRSLLTILPEAKTLLRHATDRFKLSARAYFRTIKVAQTIADLAGSTQIETAHMAEALQYRQQEHL